MLQLLAGHEAPDLTDQIRARAALGAIRGALLHADPDGDPAIVRAAILAAACGALGIPAPRAHDRPSADRTDPVAQSIEGIGKLKEI